MKDKQTGTFVALIRGINVGRAKRVAMADLRELFSQLGFEQVRTLLNSGNVVFRAVEQNAKDLARPIEEGMTAELGVTARTLVLTAAELDRVVRENPLAESAKNPSRLLIAFPAEPADVRMLQPLVEQDWSPEELAVGSRAAYLWCPDGVLKSRLPEAIARTVGDAVTTRNWSTVLKLYRQIGDTHQSRS